MYDEIRSYTDSEVRPALRRITESPAFWRLIDKVAPRVPHFLIKGYLRLWGTTDQVQRRVLYPLVQQLQNKAMTSFSTPGLPDIPHDLNALFISNHRDIIIDPVFMCKSLLESGHPTAHLAIGNNLLMEQWIADFVRLNKAFVVRRGGGLSEIKQNSEELSGYIHYLIEDQRHSIWIAQREGRAKDSSDHTQDSVLKMLTIGGSGEPYERLAALNICPVCLSYEYDPCDYLKAKEMQLKRDVPGWRKSPKDDMENMLVGIRGRKGRVVFHYTPCIREEILELGRTIEDKREFFRAVACLIDQRIHQNYQIYPGNRVAYDLLIQEAQNLLGADAVQEDDQTLQPIGGYTEEEKQTFLRYLRRQVARIHLDNPDRPFLTHCILEMYANPLRNYLASTK